MLLIPEHWWKNTAVMDFGIFFFGHLFLILTQVRKLLNMYGTFIASVILTVRIMKYREKLHTFLFIRKHYSVVSFCIIYWFFLIIIFDKLKIVFLLKYSAIIIHLIDANVTLEKMLLLWINWKHIFFSFRIFKFSSNYRNNQFINLVLLLTIILICGII